MRDTDARRGPPVASETGQERRDEEPSSRQVVVRKQSSTGESHTLQSADTAVATRSPDLASEMPPDRTGTDSDIGVDDTQISSEDNAGNRTRAEVLADAIVGTTLLDRYEITRKIGQGGMGAVYEAKHTLIGKRVAVKVLLDKYADRDQIVARLEQEARLASSIGHEHIIDITDFGKTADERTFVVMEFLEGESLGQCLNRDGPLPEQRALLIAHQVADALHAAHEKGILHRDIKPENIFLLERKGRDFVKVVDFGISKSLRPDDGAEGESPRLTQTGMVLGTPLYMSPEQASGGEALDRRIDVYSLGVIMYEMATGEVPFQGNNYLSIISRVCNEEPRPPRELRPDLSREFEAIILRALAKKPEDRYQSCEELADDLTALLDTPDRSTARRIVLAKPRRRRGRRVGLKILAWVAGLAVIMSAVAITVYVLMSGSGQRTVIIQQPVIAPTAGLDAGAAPVAPVVPVVPVADAAPAVQMATIKVVSTPKGATIYAGGRRLGTSPLEFPLPKENRTLDLIAELEGHDDTRFFVNPFDDDGKVVPVRLKKPKRGKRTYKIPNKSRPQPDTTNPTDKDSSSGTAGGELRGNPYKRPEND